MKPFPLLRFVPKPLGLTRLFHRQAKPMATPTPGKPPGPPPEPIRYTPVWFGGQIMPFIIDPRNRDRRGDDYDGD